MGENSTRVILNELTVLTVLVGSVAESLERSQYIRVILILYLSSHCHAHSKTVVLGIVVTF